METTTKTRQTNEDRTRMTLSASEKYRGVHDAYRQKAKHENKPLTSVCWEGMEMAARIWGIVDWVPQHHDHHMITTWSPHDHHEHHDTQPHDTHTPMKSQDYINKIKSKVKDPLTKRLRYTSNDAVIDDAVSYYYEELKHSKQISWSVSDLKTWWRIWCLTTLVLTGKQANPMDGVKTFLIIKCCMTTSKTNRVPTWWPTKVGASVYVICLIRHHSIWNIFPDFHTAIGSGRISEKVVSFTMSEYTCRNTVVIQQVSGMFYAKSISVRSISMTGELSYHV